MKSFIYNYCGTWKDQEGNLLLIEEIDDRRVSVTYVKAGEDKPALRPWLDGAPAANMIGNYDPGWEPSLDVELAKPGDPNYRTPTIYIITTNQPAATHSWREERFGGKRCF
jgi:hypothetical protein